MNIINTNLNLYNTFLVVYETLNLRRAAEALYLTRSAVGQKIKELENQLGCVLFTPNSKGVTPTNVAHNLYPVIQNAVNSISYAENNIKEFTSDSTGIIRISVETLPFNCYLSDFMKEFCIKYPKVTFEFFGPESNTETIKEMKIDLVFHLDRTFVGTDFKIADVLSTESAFVATKSFLKKHGLTQNITKEQLSGLPIIVERNSWKEFLRKNDISTEPYIMTECAAKAYSIAKNSIGIGYYYKGLLETVNTHDTDMVYVNVKDIKMPIMNEIVAFNKNLSPPARAFLDGFIKFNLS